MSSIENARTVRSDWLIAYNAGPVPTHIAVDRELTIIGVRARGLGGCSPLPRLGQNHYFFGQKPNFSGRSQQPKKWKKYFLYLLNEKKTEFILFSQIKCPKSGIFTNNYYWMWWVGQSNFASWHSSFFRALSKIFSGKDGSAPYRKNWPVRLWLTLSAMLEPQAVAVMMRLASGETGEASLTNDNRCADDWQ